MSYETAAGPFIDKGATSLRLSETPQRLNLLQMSSLRSLIHLTMAGSR